MRQELALALKDKEVIPVLVRGAEIPPPDVLPEPLKALSHMQGIEIRRDYGHDDIKLLVEQLGRLPRRPRNRHESLSCAIRESIFTKVRLTGDATTRRRGRC